MSLSFQNNPFNFLDLQLAVFLTQSLGKQLDAGIDGIDMRRRGLGEPAEFDHGADQGVDLDGATDLDVLQHRGLVFAHLFRASHHHFAKQIQAFSKGFDFFLKLVKNSSCWKKKLGGNSNKPHAVLTSMACE